MAEYAFDAQEFRRDAFKTVVWDSVVGAAIKALFSAAAWLNLPIISTIVTQVIRKATDKLFELLVLFVDVGNIRITNEKAREEFEESVVILAIIAKHNGIDSGDFKNMREAAREAFEDLVTYSIFKRL